MEKSRVASLTEKLRTGNTRVRVSAAWILGEMADLGAVGPLIDALGDDEFEVRGNAARALGRISDPRAFEPLMELLGDGHLLVRQRAIEALGRLRDKRAMETLIALFEDRTEDQQIRSAAATALGYLDRRPRTLWERLLGRRKWVIKGDRWEWLR